MSQGGARSAGSDVAEPVRRCVGCGRSVPKAGLLRLVADNGRLVADATARLPGRGAYVHRDPACWQAAVSRRAFARALRTAVAAPDRAPFAGRD